MRKLKGVCMSVAIGAAVLVPVQAQADPNNPCFASDTGAGVEDAGAHYGWALNRSADAVANNLAGKVAMVFNCNSVSDAQVAQAFGQISRLIGQQGLPVSCFDGDQGVLSTDAAGHEGWAQARSRSQVRDNLAWKSAAAIRCLPTAERRASLFGDESAMLARVPGSAPSAPAPTTATNAQWVVTPQTPIRAGQKFTMSWSVPPNHSNDAWIGIVKAGEAPGKGSGVSWEYLHNAGTSGSRQFTHPAPSPGVWDAYIYPEYGFEPVVGPFTFVVDP